MCLGEYFEVSVHWHKRSKCISYLYLCLKVCVSVYARILSVFESLYLVRALYKSVRVHGGFECVWVGVGVIWFVCLRGTIQVCVDGWVCVLVGE